MIIYRNGLIVGLMLVLSACGEAEKKEQDKNQPAAEITTASEGKAERTLPNIVLIIGDDHGWPYYGFLGDENVVTPNLDRLADEAALFTVAHSTSNHCRPTLQTLVTGLYPSQYSEKAVAFAEKELEDDQAYQDANGRERQARWLVAETHAITEVETLPRLLAKAGYVSFQGGKWWEQSYKEAGFTDGMSQGWSWEDQMQSNGFFEFMGGEGIELGRTTFAPLQAFIENSEQPFFIWYGPALPHTPLNPPEEHRAHYEAEGFSESAKDYYGNITWFDHGIGKMLGMLEEKGALDNTMVVYVNDNGWEQPATVEYKGDNDLYSNGGRRGKSSLFDTAFRTPIFFRLPGAIKPAENDSLLVNAADIVPTILDYAGVERPSGLPGYSLRAVIEGKEFEGRDYLIGQVTSHRGDSDYFGNPVGASDDLMGRDVDAYYLRSLDWHFAWIKDEEIKILHDMKNDPLGEENVADTHPELVATFQKEIEAWKALYVSEGQ